LNPLAEEEPGDGDVDNVEIRIDNCREWKQSKRSYAIWNKDGKPIGSGAIIRLINSDQFGGRPDQSTQAFVVTDAGSDLRRPQ